MEDRDIMSCNLSIVDIYGDKTTLKMKEHVTHKNEITQILNWFKVFLNAMGYEFVEEVKVVNRTTQHELSSKDE